MLALCSARTNLASITKFFYASTELASLWYSHYLEICHTGLVNRTVYQNLCEHIIYNDNRLTNFYKN